MTPFAISRWQSFTGSTLFQHTFDEGMSLVEETARYLDGPGRENSVTCRARIAMLDAGDSIALTTRLMQRSWLLVQRAVYEGDMKSRTRRAERYRLGSRKSASAAARPTASRRCPKSCRSFCRRSDDLYRRIALRRRVVRQRPKSRPARAARWQCWNRRLGAAVKSE